MAMKLYSDSDIQDIADAIRSKNGSSDTYKVSQMATAISNIPSGGGSTIMGDLQNDFSLVTYSKSSADYISAIYRRDSGSTSLGMTKWHSGTFTVYVASTSITESHIGDSISQHWTQWNLQSSPYYVGGPAVALETGNLIRSYPYANPTIVKYASVTVSNQNNYVGKAVVCDKDWKILTVPMNWSDLVTALNNHTIDISNGINIIGTSFESSSSASTKYNSPYALNFYS